MPAAVLIPAAAALTGSVIQSRSQNRALSVQRRAADQQIALERERDEARASRYSTAMEDYRKQQAEYDQMRRALLSHYGVNYGAPAGADGAKAAAPGVSLGGLLANPQATMLGPGGAPITPGTPGPEGPEAMEGEDAFDWRRYGVR